MTSTDETRTAGRTARAYRLVGAAALGLGLLALSGCTAEPARQALSAPVPGPTGSQPQDQAQAPAPRPTAVLQVPVTGSSIATLAATPSTPAPVSLTIASVEVTVPIDPVGVQSDGQMEIPPLAERAGWYRFGASPGEAAGTAVVAAHVDSVASAGLGPFARLTDVQVGDAVQVTLDSGGVAQYTVTGVERTAKPAVVWADVFTRDGAPQLVLVTCGGEFSRDARSYTDNVIVTAEPVGVP